MDTNGQESDDEIIRLIQIGDSGGFSALYSKYRKEFIQWVTKLTKCSLDDGREYYQATVLIVYENIHTGKLSTELTSSLKTYLFGVGKNVVHEQSRMYLKTEKIKADNLMMMNLDEANNLQETAPPGAHLEIIRECLEQLGRPCHSLLDMFYFSGKNMDEIAVLLNYKNGDSAKNQKYKCMERLRKLVSEAMYQADTVTLTPKKQQYNNEQSLSRHRMD